MKIKYQLSLLAVAIVLFITGCTPQPSIPSNADSMWKCNATDARQAHWFQYAATRVEAARLVRDRCEAGSYRSTCVVRCIPPSSRWHCVSVDAKGHTWYWNSVNKTVAIRNARNICKKQTAFGGCRVPSGNCSVT